MPCTCPVECWPAPPSAASKRPVYSPQKSYRGARSFLRPCGQCISCRIEKSQDTATRIMHETTLHDHNLFLTLTYDEKHLPAHGSLNPEDLTKLLKRLRHHQGPLRYYGVGEYGTELLRPHLHIITFGLALPDLTPAAQSKAGEVLYTSQTLTDIWGKGIAQIGTVTPKSAAYVARYSLKKITGDRKEEAYRRVNPETGETWTVAPEFARMSRRPGIGMGWYQQFKNDCFPSDYLIRDGRRIRVPRLYALKLPEHELTALKLQRRQHATSEQAKADNTERRLMTKHESAGLRADHLKREL